MQSVLSDTETYEQLQFTSPKSTIKLFDNYDAIHWLFLLNPTYFYLGEYQISERLSSLSPKAAIASGLPYILLPVQDFQNFITTLQMIQNCTFSSINGYTECVCSPENLTSFPNLQFSSNNGIIFSINSSTYLDYRQAPNCLLLIAPSTNQAFNISSAYQNQWMLGSPFLQSYYTKFDQENHSLSFARIDSITIPSLRSCSGEGMNYQLLMYASLISIIIFIVLIAVKQEILKNIIRDNKKNKVKKIYGIVTNIFPGISFFCGLKTAINIYDQYKGLGQNIQDFSFLQVPNNPNLCFMPDPNLLIIYPSNLSIQGQSVYVNNQLCTTFACDSMISSVFTLYLLILYVICLFVIIHYNFKNSTKLAQMFDFLSSGCLFLTLVSTFGTFNGCLIINSEYLNDDGSILQPIQQLGQFGHFF